MILSKPDAKTYFEPVYGCNTTKSWLVTKMMYGSLEQVFEERKTQKKPLKPHERLRFLLDAARYLQCTMRPTPHRVEVKDGKKIKHTDAVILHRDTNCTNVRVDNGFEQALQNSETNGDYKMADLRKLPPIAKIGNLGCVTTTSKSFSKEGRGDVYFMPPDAVEDSKDYDQKVDIWRWGLLAYEVWTQTPWTKHTSGDRTRIVIERFKPKESKEMLEINSQQWNGHIKPPSAPDVLYEIVQAGCWQHKCIQRPPIDVIVDVTAWALDDALVEAKLRPPHPLGSRPSDAAEIIALCGFKLFPPPSSMKFNLSTYKHAEDAHRDTATAESLRVRNPDPVPANVALMTSQQQDQLVYDWTHTKVNKYRDYLPQGKSFHKREEN